MKSKQASPLATRIAGNRFLASKPSALRWTDSTQSPRVRIRSLAWFLTGGWRSEGIRFVARLALTVIGARSTAARSQTEALTAK